MSSTEAILAELTAAAAGTAAVGAGVGVGAAVGIASVDSFTSAYSSNSKATFFELDDMSTRLSGEKLSKSVSYDSS